MRTVVDRGVELTYRSWNWHWQMGLDLRYLLVIGLLGNSLNIDSFVYKVLTASRATIFTCMLRMSARLRIVFRTLTHVKQSSTLVIAVSERCFAICQ